ncbi:type I-E CRISPR-associated protein Cse1/CasA [Corynebacterium uberis]|uniref:type I-E CRISPR-associated protein Cse1/CasA n=1 Tax=Corynebacterium uberis TaxID=2883169 RepID=UPI001D0B563E|nr:type I-E CRISPR-associated protein Cse1/CasA [Corynebacterium uberis]UDL73994.1 type I-E CRISPR-associated protein Cse1/CasA [Corynebacterium uberis]UDL75122.1 type I-E CRISPR-associated protein Cse1/CasA [Corynebacterium uberis]UDL77335.1 type I-E CRISPR-associated protein Cse1/CasA [Corynebacterium uberis]UDL79619.1 type I-E CRISPR-associated protein Cse1/CasA [Corynebacterium uberis]UDL81752.1 type I-E CRISPR-associated protein Cse1/CasA [Corynebacterium uberis]
MTRFSLLDEPWINCHDAQGATVTASIRDIFDGSVTAARIVGDSPTQDYAVLRVLLAIFWRAHQPDYTDIGGSTFHMDEWFTRVYNQLSATGRDEQVLDYLNAYEDRFNLFDPTAPFMQVADLHTQSGKVSEIRRIVPEAEGRFFTMRSGAGRETITPAEAARWVIHCHAFDYSGIKSGAVGDDRVKGGRGYPIGTGWTGMTGGTVVHGENLLHTMLLNTTRECLKHPTDKPVWERSVDSAAERIYNQPSEPITPQGPADLATWQTRRIRLYRNEEGLVDQVLVSNGDKIAAAGANVMADPMTPYRWSKNKSTATETIYYPRPYDAERTTWRSLDAMLACESDAFVVPGKKDQPPKRPDIFNTLADYDKGPGVPEVLNTQIVSVEYGPQSAIITSTVDGTLGIPLHLLAQSAEDIREDISDAARATVDAAVSLGSFAGNLLVAAGGEYAFGSSATDRALHELEPIFLRWLARITPENVEKSAEGWQHVVRRAIKEHADILQRGAGPKAMIGRQVFQNAEDTKGRFVTSATARSLLERKLNQDLPLTAPKKKEKEQK